MSSISRPFNERSFNVSTDLGTSPFLSRSSCFGRVRLVTRSFGLRIIDSTFFEYFSRNVPLDISSIRASQVSTLQDTSLRAHEAISAVICGLFGFTPTDTIPATIKAF